MPATESGSMDQVRELLFGGQLKELEIKMLRQEESFHREIGSAKDSLKARIESLENFMKSEIATVLHRIKEEQQERESALKDELRERAEAIKTEQRERQEAIKNEQRERAEAFAQMAKDLSILSESFDRKIAKVSSTLDTAERELRQLLQSESNSLSGSIDEKYSAALAVVSKTASHIREDMVHRSALSNMFNEIAVKLSGQWTLDVDHMLTSGPSETAPEPDSKE